MDRLEGLKAWHQGLDPALVQEKFGLMAESAWSFFRGSAALFYRDYQTDRWGLPAAWQADCRGQVWLQGDCHLLNFGLLGESAETVHLGINDFDETGIGPFYFDLVRFGTGLHLFAERLDIDHGVSAEKLIQSFLKTYQSHLQALVDGQAPAPSEFLQGLLRRVRAEQSPQSQWAHWTEEVSGRRQFRLDLEDLAALESSDRAAWHDRLTEHFLDRPGVTVRDVCRRLHSGLGSLGYPKWYALLEGPASLHGLPEIWEIKQQGPCLLPSVQPPFNSPADRVAEGAKHLQFSGSASVRAFGGTPSFTVQKISPWKRKIKPSDWDNPDDLADFVRDLAGVLAQAHSAKALEILGDIKDWEHTKTRLAQSAADQAVQTKKDWEHWRRLFGTT